MTMAFVAIGEFLRRMTILFWLMNIYKYSGTYKKAAEIRKKCI
jgi:hypothetical protein